MTNEWLEFKAYTDKPTYFSSGKRDFSYLGRFHLKAILDLEGLGRILTIIARGYLFHDKDGNVLKDDAYSRIEYARKALCAWCSIDTKESSDVNFAHLSKEFPELVSETGEGWFCSHIKGITKFSKKKPSLISASTMKTISAISKGFTKMWTKKEKQMQVPPFALNTKGAWVLRFDDIIADALELGPLQMFETELPPHIAEKLKSMDLNGVPYDVVSEVVCFCIANKRDNNDWVHLPVANFDCYYGNTNFSKKWLSKIPDTILEREVTSGVSRVRLKT